MRIDGGRLGWGVFFVTLGLVPLAVRFGWVDPAWFEGIWRLWPLILIGIGVGLILRRTAFAAVGNVIVGLTFGLMIGGALATPINAGISCLPGGTADASPITQQGTFAGDRAEIDIAFPCAEVVVSARSGSDWSVVATGIDADDLDLEADATSLEIDRSGGSGIWGQGEQTGLQIELPTGPAMDLAMDVSAGSATASLGGTRVESLSLSVNAGDATTRLTETTLDAFSVSVNAGSAAMSLPASPWDGSASVNVGSLEVCVPDGAAVRITSSAALGSVDVGPGFSQTGEGWVTPAWAAAGEGADLSLSVNLGSAAIRVGGCE
jgi:hypothetical protein